MRDRLILAAVVLAVFGPTVLGAFHLDDYSILSDPALTHWRGVEQLWQRTRPLTYLTFWANYQIGGPNPIGYHVVNLGLHLAAVLVMPAALAGLLPGRLPFWASLLFAVHPIQMEPVAFIFARGTLLATLFCLLSLRSWVRGARVWAVGWFALALLSKEECVAFPLFLALLHFSISKNRRELGWIAGMLALSAAAGLRVLAAAAATPGSGAGPQAGISPFSYWLAQGVAIPRYFQLLIAPWGFTIDPEIAISPAWGWIGWGVIGLGVLVASTRFSGARAGLWFLGGLVLLLPSSSILPAADLAADRRMYLPLIALMPCAVLLMRQWPQWAPAALAAALALISVGRAQVWMTEKSLWQEAVERAPAKIRPKLQLARVLPPADSLKLLAQARLQAPDDPRIPAEEGRILLEEGDAAGALDAFGRALALHPGDARALNNRGAALMALGQREAARQDFERALSTDPCLFDALFNLRRMGVDRLVPEGCAFTSEQENALSP